MASPVGIALEATMVYAARTSGGATFGGHPWDPSSPEHVVDLLRAQFGNVQAIALSVGLGFLEIATPELPPMSVADRRRVLLRDADRYFPVEGAMAVAASAASSLAFATDADQLHRWVRAFEEWAPIRAIVATPTAIATAIPESGHFVIDADVGEVGLLLLANGTLREARRVAISASNSIPANATHLEMEGSGISSTMVAAATGAQKFLDASTDAMLLDASLESELRARRTRRQQISLAVAAVALIALAFTADARRDNTLRATQNAVDSLKSIAAPGVAAQTRLAQLEEESRLLSTRTANTSDPLHTLAAVSKALPDDAFVDQLSWDGKEWRVSGSANQAANVVPRLDSARVFTNVRSIGASTRFRDGARMRESFSVAFGSKGDSVAKR